MIFTTALDWSVLLTWTSNCFLPAERINRESAEGRIKQENELTLSWLPNHIGPDHRLNTIYIELRQLVWMLSKFTYKYEIWVNYVWFLILVQQTAHKEYIQQSIMFEFAVGCFSFPASVSLCGTSSCRMAQRSELHFANWLTSMLLSCTSFNTCFTVALSGWLLRNAI
jgi:hypothetical protein